MHASIKKKDAKGRGRKLQMAKKPTSAEGKAEGNKVEGAKVHAQAQAPAAPQPEPQSPSLSPGSSPRSPNLLTSTLIS